MRDRRRTPNTEACRCVLLVLFRDMEEFSEDEALSRTARLFGLDTPVVRGVYERWTHDQLEATLQPAFASRIAAPATPDSRSVAAFVRAAYEEDRPLTIAAVRAHISAALGISIGIDAVRSMLRDLGFHWARSSRTHKLSWIPRE